MKFLSNWLFSLSFITGVFNSVLKTGKVLPAFKEDSKLDYSNYCPMSLLSSIEKILEKQIRDFIHSSIKIILSLTYSLDSYYSILHLMP